MKEIDELDWENNEEPQHEGPFGGNESDGLPMFAAIEDDEPMFERDSVMELPILTLRNTVLFPNLILPITISRDRSMKLVKKAYKGNKVIGVVAQRDVSQEEPNPSDLHAIGTVGRIVKLLRLPNNNITIIIQGQQKFELSEFLSEKPYLVAKVRMLEDTFPSTKKKEVQALLKSLRETAAKIIKLNPDIPKDAQLALENIESPQFLTYFLASNLNIDLHQKQELLEFGDGEERGTKVLEHMLQEMKMLELRQEIHNKVNTDLDQQQRDYFLRQQMKVLQDELGMGGFDQDVEKLKMRGLEKPWPQQVRDHFYKEVERLARINPASAEYPVYLNYCELMLELPWEKYSQDSFDLKRAQEILDRDHFGLQKVKRRIIEYLAVLKLKRDMRGPILCLYGPPGVGKTSLGRSIAESLGREYIRMSLGGLRDEAELRGHRKTYIGSMPGRILQNLKRAGTSNPVFILDEIDKLSSDFRGDPSSALLEILDPEQNKEFVDNYLEVAYDLSKVMFIATANSLDSIQPALRDRMEIIELSGYTQEEKLEIAKRHLVSKQRKEHGLMAKHLTVPDKTIERVIDEYTRESGVRNLERHIGSIARYAAKSVAMEEPYQKNVSPKMLEEILGPPMFDKELYQDNSYAGMVTGLAWTRVGGEILFLEASLSRGKGGIILSGQLGDVMKESATTALSYLRAHAEDLGIDYRIFDRYDLHVHLPAGAVPKDGPSAGIGMLTAMASVYTQRKVKERLAMTGEISLRGKVLPVGGIKEKVLAAKRAGILEIILPKRNRKDIEEIEPEYLANLAFHYVEDVEEVLKIALLKEKVEKPIAFVVE